MQTTEIFSQKISRLILDCSSFSGGNFFSREKNDELQNYFSASTVKKNLFGCEKAGINAMYLHADKYAMRLVREYRNEGGNLIWIAETANEMLSFEGNAKQAAGNGANGIAIDGISTEALFNENNFGELERRLAFIRSLGVGVGLSVYAPELIELSERAGLNVDFYAAALFPKKNLANPVFEKGQASEVLKAAVQCKKPCIIRTVPTGEDCCNLRRVDEKMFKELFAEIKETDAIAAAVFPGEENQLEHALSAI